ncbi:hypothetical protein G6F55_014366 [Rhizopus delemar]|nr:hypothetical protein G6F55_014366 [Rhizopus delemar]
MAAGIATPTTSSERFTDAGSSRSKASNVTASTLAPKLRVRSISSASMKNAPVVSTELISPLSSPAAGSPAGPARRTAAWPGPPRTSSPG